MGEIIVNIDGDVGQFIQYGQAPPFLHKGRHLVGLRSCFYDLTLPSLVLHIEVHSTCCYPSQTRKDRGW